MHVADPEIGNRAAGEVARWLCAVVDNDVGEDFKAGVSNGDSPLRCIGEWYEYGLDPPVGWIEWVGREVARTECGIADFFDDLNVWVAAEAEIDTQVGQVVEGHRVAEVEDVLARRFFAEGWVDGRVGTQRYRP